MNTIEPITVYLVDDHSVVVEGLAHRLGIEEDLYVCGVSMTFQEALQALPTVKPQVLITDLTLGADNGISLIEQVHALIPKTKIVVLSMHDESKYALRCKQAGASGYVMKSKPFDVVIDAVRTVASGETWFSENALERNELGLGYDGGSSGLPIHILSKREFDVFKLIGEGYRPRHIAEKLFISPGTVDSHCKNIRSKFQFENMTQLIEQASEWVKEELPE